MTEITVSAGGPTYSVRVGRGLRREAAGLRASHGRLAVVADAKVAGLHELPGCEELPCRRVEGGESAKTLGELELLLEFLAEAGLDRSSGVITFGGGMVSDLGGMAAALFKRGVAVWHVPTTLLAQVDASVGGKTAVNLQAGKNLAGVFHQPSGVLVDTETLATLPDEELASGLGEVLKTALIGGETELERLEQRAGALLQRDPDALAEIVADCVTVKARVVESDPTEQGPRAVLNLGHTLGHAIEGAAGYGAVPHGVCVATGIGLALRLSRGAGLLEDEDLPGRVERLAETLGLPLDLETLTARHGLKLDPLELWRHLDQDKKGAVGQPRFVLPRRAGDVAYGVELERSSVDALLGG